MENGSDSFRRGILQVVILVILVAGAIVAYDAWKKYRDRIEPSERTGVMVTTTSGERVELLGFDLLVVVRKNCEGNRHSSEMFLVNGWSDIHDPGEHWVYLMDEKSEPKQISASDSLFSGLDFKIDVVRHRSSEYRPAREKYDDKLAENVELSSKSR